MPDIKLGQYVHGDSLLHILDPRTKIICCLFIIISVLLNFSWYYLLFLVVLMAAAIRSTGMSFRFVFQSLRSIRYLLIITLVFQAVLTPGDPLANWGPIRITAEGLQMGLINLLRLLILYMGSLVLLLTTSPIKLASGIEYLLLPLSKLGIPIHNFSTILSISFRFIPTLVEQAATIKNAQSSRGAQFASPRLMVRLKSYLSILIPLFEASLARAEELGDAMDSRCYTPHPNRVRMSGLTFKAADIAVLMFMVAVLTASLVI